MRVNPRVSAQELRKEWGIGTRYGTTPQKKQNKGISKEDAWVIPYLDLTLSQIRDLLEDKALYSTISDKEFFDATGLREKPSSAHQIKQIMPSVRFYFKQYLNHYERRFRTSEGLELLSPKLLELYYDIEHFISSASTTYVTIRFKIMLRKSDDSYITGFHELKEEVKNKVPLKNLWPYWKLIRDDFLFSVELIMDNLTRKEMIDFAVNKGVKFKQSLRWARNNLDTRTWAYLVKEYMGYDEYLDDNDKVLDLVQLSELANKPYLGKIATILGFNPRLKAGIFDPEDWEYIKRYATELGKRIIKNKKYKHPSYPDVPVKVAQQLGLGFSPLQIIKEKHPNTTATKKEAHEFFSNELGYEDWLEWLQFKHLDDSRIKPLRSELVIRWLARQKERRQIDKLFVVRRVHGPAQEAREYTFNDILDEIQDEDLIRGVNTRIEDAFEQAAQRTGKDILDKLKGDFRVLAAKPKWLHPRYQRSTRVLNTPHALVLEGEEMRHCVGGYVTAVENNRCIILSMRVGKHRSTAEVSPDASHVFQHMGPNNVQPEPVLQRLLDKVLKRAREYNNRAVRNPTGNKAWWEYLKGWVVICD